MVFTSFLFKFKDFATEKLTVTFENQIHLREGGWCKNGGAFTFQHISGMKVIFPNVFFDDALVGVLEFNVGQNLS